MTLKNRSGSQKIDMHVQSSQQWLLICRISKTMIWRFKEHFFKPLQDFFVRSQKAVHVQIKQYITHLPKSSEKLMPSLILPPTTHISMAPVGPPGVCTLHFCHQSIHHHTYYSPQVPGTVKSHLESTHNWWGKHTHISQMNKERRRTENKNSNLFGEGYLHFVFKEGGNEKTPLEF